MSTLCLSEFLLLDHFFTPRASTVGKVDCDVDESCPWFFIGTVLATGPELCIINTLQPARCVNKLSLEVLVYCNTRLIDDIRVII